MSDQVVYKTKTFSVKVPSTPHITWEEGGHVFIEVNNHDISDRWELSYDEACELMWLTQVVGLAFKQTMQHFGVELYRLNIQDNANWSFIRKTKPVLHIHIYGRSLREKNGNTAQTYGNSLSFPYVDTGFYDDFTPLDIEKMKYLSDTIATLARSPHFSEHAPECLMRA